MAVTLANPARNAAVTAVTTLLNAGRISWRAANGTSVLAITTLAATAFGAPTNGVANLAGVPLTSAAATAADTVALALFMQTDGTTEVLRCTVGLAAASPDITLTSTAVAVGETITLNSLTYTQPA